MYYEKDPDYLVIRDECLQNFKCRSSQTRCPWSMLNWYAIDKNGHVGSFFAPTPSIVPAEFFAMTPEQYLSVYDYFTDLELKYDPDFTHEQFLEHLKTTGFFYYAAETKPTSIAERYPVPASPVLYRDLPEDIAGLVALTKYCGDFRHSQKIDISKSWKKCYPG